MSAQKCPDCGTWWQAAEHRCAPTPPATDRTTPTYPPIVPPYEWWKPGRITCGGGMVTTADDGLYLINCASAA